MFHRRSLRAPRRPEFHCLSAGNSCSSAHGTMPVTASLASVVVIINPSFTSLATLTTPESPPLYRPIYPPAR